MIKSEKGVGVVIKGSGFQIREELKVLILGILKMITEDGDVSKADALAIVKDCVNAGMDAFIDDKPIEEDGRDEFMEIVKEFAKNNKFMQDTMKHIIADETEDKGFKEFVKELLSEVEEDD